MESGATDRVALSVLGGLWPPRTAVGDLIGSVRTMTGRDQGP